MALQGIQGNTRQLQGNAGQGSPGNTGQLQGNTGQLQCNAGQLQITGQPEATLTLYSQSANNLNVLNDQTKSWSAILYLLVHLCTVFHYYAMMYNILSA